MSGEQRATAPPPAACAVLAAAASAPLTGGPSLSLWASCPGGCETEAATELAALGWRPLDVLPAETARRGVAAGLQWERGSVYGRADLAAVYRTLLAARTVSRVSLLLGAFAMDTLDELYELVRGLDLGRMRDAPFAVEPRRSGDHPFRSPDIGRVAGQAVIDSCLAARGRRLPVSLDDPATVLRIELAGRRLRAGFDLAERSLHRRGYAVYRHPAGVKPTLAAALLAMAEWREDDRLLDPMCGGGTILIEAALAALRRPVAGAAWRRLEMIDLHDAELADETAAALRRAQRPRCALRIAGIDRCGRHVDGARLNVEAAELAGTVTVERGDATRRSAAEPLDCVVTNPPYGIRAGRPAALGPLYREALARVAERLAPGGRVVMLTAATRTARAAAAAAGLTVRARRRISLGSFGAAAVLLGARRRPTQ